MDEVPAYPRIPYGEADFRGIRLNGWLYVDKTRFLRRLERERYVLLIRPRRFGKTLWVSLLENYYDRFWADDFDASFADTDIGQHPTGEQSRYRHSGLEILAAAGRVLRWPNVRGATRRAVGDAGTAAGGANHEQAQPLGTHVGLLMCLQIGDRPVDRARSVLRYQFRTGRKRERADACRFNEAAGIHRRKPRAPGTRAMM